MLFRSSRYFCFHPKRLKYSLSIRSFCFLDCFGQRAESGVGEGADEIDRLARARPGKSVRLKRNQAAKLRSVTKERQRDLRMNVVRAPFPVHDNFRLGGRNPIALDELKRGIGARRKPIRR